MLAALRLVALWCLADLLGRVSSATVRFVGTNATVSWDDPTAWSTGTVPATGDDVFIETNRTVFLSGSAALNDDNTPQLASIASLYLNASALTLEIGPGGVEVAGAMTHVAGTVSGPGALRVDGDMTWTNGQHLETSVVGSTTVAGILRLPSGSKRVTVRRFYTSLVVMSGGNWTIDYGSLLSVPVMNVTGGIFYINPGVTMPLIGALAVGGAASVSLNSVDRTLYVSAIYLSGNCTVNLLSGVTALSNGTVSDNATLNANGFVTVDGAMTFTQGSVVGIGPLAFRNTSAVTFSKTVVSGNASLTNEGVMTIANGVTFKSRTVKNSGLIAWTAGNILLSVGATLQTTKAGSIVCDVASDVVFDTDNGAAVLFTNGGALYKRGVAQLTLAVKSTVTEAIYIAGGTLTVIGAVTVSAPISLESNSTLVFAGSSAIINGLNSGSAITGSGAVTVRNATTNVQGVWNLTGPLTVTGGVLTFQGLSVVNNLASSFTMSGGSFNNYVVVPAPYTLISGGVLSAYALFQAQNVTVNGGVHTIVVNMQVNDTVQLNNNATLTGDGSLAVGNKIVVTNGNLMLGGTIAVPRIEWTTSAKKTFYSGRLAVTDYMLWTAGLIECRYGVSINIKPTAVLRLEPGGQMTEIASTLASYINIQGAMIKNNGTDGSTTNSSISPYINVEANGTVTVLSGTLFMSNSLLNYGTVTTSTNGSLVINAPAGTNGYVGYAGSSLLSTGFLKFTGGLSTVKAFSIYSALDTLVDGASTKLTMEENGGVLTLGNSVNVVAGTLTLVGQNLTVAVLQLSSGASLIGLGNGYAKVGDYTLSAGTTLSWAGTWETKSSTTFVISASATFVNFVANGNVILNSGGSITGVTVAVQGSFTWNGGTIGSNGVQLLTLTTYGPSSVATSATKTITNAVWNVAANLTFVNGSSDIRTTDASVIDVAKGVTFYHAAAASITFISGSQTYLFMRGAYIVDAPSNVTVAAFVRLSGSVSLLRNASTCRAAPPPSTRSTPLSTSATHSATTRCFA